MIPAVKQHVFGRGRFDEPLCSLHKPVVKQTASRLPRHKILRQIEAVSVVGISCEANVGGRKQYAYNVVVVIRRSAGVGCADGLFARKFGDFRAVVFDLRRNLVVRQKSKFFVRVRVRNHVEAVVNGVVFRVIEVHSAPVSRDFYNIVAVHKTGVYAKSIGYIVFFE